MNTETLINIFLAQLAMAGFMVAWERTGIKQKLLSLFVWRFRGKTVDEVEAHTILFWGAFGELLNCRFCLSAWVGLLFFLGFSYVTEVTLVALAFLLGPLTIELVLGVSMDRLVSNVEEESPLAKAGRSKKKNPKDSFPLQPPKMQVDKNGGVVETLSDDTVKVKMPTELRQRVNALRQDAQKHREFLMENKGIIQMLVNSTQCAFEGCEDLVQSYNNELKELEEEAKAKGATCPNCIKGELINKYMVLMVDKNNESQDNIK